VQPFQYGKSAEPLREKALASVWNCGSALYLCHPCDCETESLLISFQVGRLSRAKQSEKENNDTDQDQYATREYE
jgi:hypothetical protein